MELLPDPTRLAATRALPSDAPDLLQQVTAALARDHAVLLAAPLPADLDLAAAVVEACDGHVAGVAFPARWLPAHLEISDAVEAGELGDVVRVTFTGLAGGLAPYAVDLVGMLLGSDVTGLTRDGDTLTGATRHGVVVTLREDAGPSAVTVTGTTGERHATGTLEPTPERLAATAERFGRSAAGASPWGYHLLRDLRLHRLLVAAG